MGRNALVVKRVEVRRDWLLEASEMRRHLGEEAESGDLLMLALVNVAGRKEEQGRRRKQKEDARRLCP
jgi:hypothetical protein